MEHQDIALSNLRQTLLQSISDWLDNEENITDLSYFEDNEDLHIHMTNAAFEKFKLYALPRKINLCTGCTTDCYNYQMGDCK